MGVRLISSHPTQVCSAGGFSLCATSHELFVHFRSEMKEPIFTQMFEDEPAKRLQNPVTDTKAPETNWIKSSLFLLELQRQ